MKMKSALLGTILIISLLITGCSQNAANTYTSTSTAATETAAEAASEAASEAAQSADAEAGATESAEVEETEETEASEAADAEATAADSAAVQSDAAEMIKDIATIQAFTDEAVAQEDIEAIVAAGVNAPSAMNGQPWHFSVVTDAEVLEKIASDMGGGFSGSVPADFAGAGEGAPEGMTPPEGMTLPEGASDSEGMGTPPAANTSSGAKAGIADAPLVIIISCNTGSELDAGLATQNMSAEAQLLGYGTKIVSSPKMAINGSNQAEYRELLGIPEDMSAVCMLLVGKTDTADYDAVSGATERNAVDNVVTYLP